LTWLSVTISQLLYFKLTDHAIYKFISIHHFLDNRARFHLPSHIPGLPSTCRMGDEAWRHPSSTPKQVADKRSLHSDLPHLGPLTLYLPMGTHAIESDRLQVKERSTPQAANFVEDMGRKQKGRWFISSAYIIATPHHGPTHP